jgi:type IV pilus assembly protein PilO
MADLSVSKLSWKSQLVLVVLLSAGAAGAFYYWYEMPARDAIKVQENELESIQRRINRGRDAARRLEEFRKEVEDRRVRLEALKPILPEEKDAGDLLRRIQTLAVQSNLVVRGFKPQPVSTKAMHAEWPISLELEGSYHNLGAFLDRVSKFPRLINVGKLNIKAKQQPEPNGSIDVSCTATTFVLLGGANAPGAAPSASAPKKTE